MNSLGRIVYAVAALWLGAVGLWFGDLATYWQPYPDELPGKTVVAYLVGAVFLASGAAMLRRSTSRWGGAGAAVLFMFFALLWSRRIINFPQIFGTWGGTAEEIAQALGGIILVLAAGEPVRHSDRQVAWCILAFGACAVIFGILHFEAIPQTAGMVPAWLPFGGVTWAVVTGILHAAGGAALICGVLEKLAARLLTVMYAMFSVLIWVPKLVLNPGDHIAWAGNGVNLALVSAAWLVADHAEERRALPRLASLITTRAGRAAAKLSGGLRD